MNNLHNWATRFGVSSTRAGEVLTTHKNAAKFHNYVKMVLLLHTLADKVSVYVHRLTHTHMGTIAVVTSVLHY